MCFLLHCCFPFSRSSISWGELFFSLKLALVSLKPDSLFPGLHSAMPAQTYISSCTALSRVSKKLSSYYLFHFRSRTMILCCRSEAQGMRQSKTQCKQRSSDSIPMWTKTWAMSAFNWKNNILWMSNAHTAHSKINISSYTSCEYWDIDKKPKPTIALDLDSLLTSKPTEINGTEVSEQ